jgi:hypothetical protein
MVRRSFLLITLVAALSFVTLVETAGAQRQYHLDQEGAKIWINQNGSIDLFYNISLTLDSGDPINWVEIGQPNGDFTVGEAVDQAGHMLSTSDTSSGSDYKVRVTLFTPLTAGQTIWFSLTTNVGRMIFEDETNPGYVGMQFTPTWWQQASVTDLRVLIVLPPGVPSDSIRTMVNYDNLLTENGSYAVYWVRTNTGPNQQYTFGVAFPKEYIQNYVAAPPVWQRYVPWILGFGLIFGVVGTVVFVVRKRPYLIPKISMETLGIRHGLTAVEASYLLDMAPTMIVTEMLYSLLQKRAVWVEAATPSLKLKVMEQFRDKSTFAENGPLRYYEIDFLDAIGSDGTLDEERLASTVIFMRNTVEEKMHGYCRRDTIDYYKSVVAKAWEQVEQAGTPELASNAYDEQLLWLFLDPNYKDRTSTAFRDRPFEPSPLWFWYWYGYTQYHPHPTYRPNVETPAQSAKPPSIPGSDFANNVVDAVGKTSNNIVLNLEKFANAIVQAPPVAKASSEPARHGATCVCACAACACACACVSCACACAGGGVG